MRLIVGLGNPGFRYRFTRHNLGFMVVDKLSKTNSIRLGRREYNSLLGRGRIANKEVILVKPLTYMNLSGSAVRGLVKKEGLSLERVMVICDDVNMELGKIRMRIKGSSGGHNGLQSIQENLESDAFPRLRMGIGRTAGGGLTGHVLGSFKKTDLAALGEVTDKALQAIDCWLRDGIEAAMNRFNT